MGGHGGLNILPQKRWNVYNYDNREKVRSDEAAAARDEQLKLEDSRRRDAEFRLHLLRRNRGLHTSPPPEAAAASPEAPAVEARAGEGDRINLFSFTDFAALASDDGARGAARNLNPNPNPNPKRRKKEEEVRTVGPDEEKYRLGYGLAGKGVAAPWYMSRPGANGKDEEERRDREEGEGRGKKSGGKKSIEELREERRRREGKEKERERALLAAAATAARKGKEKDRGYSSRRAR